MLVIHKIASNNCPIIERTHDGDSVGRCFFYCPDGVCPRHGDVRKEIERYCETGRLTDERKRRQPDPSTIELGEHARRNQDVRTCQSG